MDKLGGKADFNNEKTRKISRMKEDHNNRLKYYIVDAYLTKTKNIDKIFQKILLFSL